MKSYKGTYYYYYHHYCHTQNFYWTTPTYNSKAKESEQWLVKKISTLTKKKWEERKLPNKLYHDKKKTNRTLR